MKYSKLLKSAVLSTALLYSGGALAQQTGDTKLTIVNPPLVVTATELNFGSYTRSAATAVVTQACPAGGDTSTVVPAGLDLTAGSCGAVTVTTTSGSAVSFDASVTATAMSATGATDLAAPTVQLYLSGFSVGTTTTSSVVSGTPFSASIGGVVNLGAGQAAGEYSGTYTFTATIN